MMNEHFLNFYRKLPWFRGKLRIGKLLFKHHIEQSEPVCFSAHGGILYHLPNTIENLGIELLINGIYEEDIIRFLKNHLPDSIIYFDIGANIGSLGLPVIKSKKISGILVLRPRRQFSPTSRKISGKMEWLIIN